MNPCMCMYAYEQICGNMYVCLLILTIFLIILSSSLVLLILSACCIRMDPLPFTLLHQEEM